MTDCYKYWGKAKQEKKGHYDCHLLVYHCLDVAAVGKSWMEKNPDFIERASKYSGLSGEAFQEWFLFFLSLHDLGKFSDSFQNLIPYLLKVLQDMSSDAIYTKRHDQRGFEYFDNLYFKHFHSRYFSSIKEGPLREFCNTFAQVVFGHHGIPPESGNTKSMPQPAKDFADVLAEMFLSGKTIQNISDLFSLPKMERKKRLEGLPYLSWQLAGLTSLFDWIASGDSLFTYCPNEIPLDEYFFEACKKGAQALQNAEILPALLNEEQGMKRLFPEFVATPTPLQQFCDEVDVSYSPQLWILEDVTGAGKTEAALTLASRLLIAGMGVGIFIALPTMATSNAMYERMACVYSLLYQDNSRPSLTLSHGSRHLSETFRNSFQSILHNGEDFDEKRDEGKAHCSRWLSDSSKKALLADVGVGTVDQILMGGLPVRYQALRILGMTQKVLIIDEVHAFDAYMNRLLENLIKAHASFGGAVILLSATIPFSVRERFCQAFLQGINREPIPLLRKESFPLVTSITSEGLSEIPVETRTSVEREVGLSFWESQEEIYSLIKKRVDEGKCLCWIRNTIKDVSDSYFQLKDRGIEKLDIFHSRFTLKDRLDIEERVIDGFGKFSSEENRKGRVLIASQVVEQSLDLDFDVMISDLAPVDLLIQRAGRLHRHERGERGKPIFHIFIPHETEEPGKDWFSRTFPHAQWVYQDTALLWKTKEILKRVGHLRMPDDARLLIESVYGMNEALDVPEIFCESEDTAWGKMMADKSMADFNSISFGQGYTRLGNMLDRWDSDERISTRLTEETTCLYFARFQDGAVLPIYENEEFPWDLSSLSLRKSILADITYDGEIQQAVEILNNERRFRYDSQFIVLNKDESPLIGMDINGKEVEISYNKEIGLIIERNRGKS